MKRHTIKKSSKCNYIDNPHIDKSRALECTTISKIPRILRPSFPEKKYISRKDEKHSAVHWGQRKLLMSEIEFLLLHGGNKKTVVIYAGGAPGDHTPFLSKLFPHIMFVLIDPSTFNIKPSKEIKIIKDFMTNELSAKLRDEYRGNMSGNTILFISDVRSVDFRIHKLEETEEEIQKDMQMQKEWYQILKPDAGMLKFRLPWFINNDSPQTTPYLAGDIHFPIYGARTTTETRLIVKGDGTRMKNYDNRKYESQMYYFNTEIRNHLFIHPVKAKGLDCCYDCAAEVFLLRKYCDTYVTGDSGKMLVGQDRDDYVGKMVDQITQNIGNGNRTLEKWKKNNEFKKRIIDNKKQQVYYVSSNKKPHPLTNVNSTKKRRTKRH
jgi:hypothetical protein